MLRRQLMTGAVAQKMGCKEDTVVSLTRACVWLAVLLLTSVSRARSSGLTPCPIGFVSRSVKSMRRAEASFNCFASVWGLKPCLITMVMCDQEPQVKNLTSRTSLAITYLTPSFDWYQSLFKAPFRPQVFFH
jgi:hypothetical protein